YLEEYREGRLSEEARRIYEALLERGALPTSRLRREAGLAGQQAAPRFDRALAELQMGFKIVKVGISDANRWKYCYVYDLFLRRFPEKVAAARAINSTQAMRTILCRYLATVLAATPEQVTRLFGWEPWRLERIVAWLAAEGIIQASVPIDGLKGGHLVLAQGGA
ncbi:MAG: winged helix DNA-binding domain-containing protein, partial [Anaerolineae bacterium]|nr:winged helix DNA-binding domain-containing protein [Anaerolineae bacterium]